MLKKIFIQLVNNSLIFDINLKQLNIIKMLNSTKTIIFTSKLDVNQIDFASMLY